MASEAMMISVLDKLNILHHTAKFTHEKITPDIICHLSLSEFEELGVTDGRIIMALRTECAVYGSNQPETEFGQAGPPKFFIPKIVLEELVEEGFYIKEIAKILCVSERTIYRRMEEYGLRKQKFTEIDDEQLDSIVSRQTNAFPHCGEGMLNELLRNDGLFIQRMRLRESLHRVDAAGVQNHDIHIGALHYVYMASVNEKLSIWRQAWANHRMRTIKTSPLKLWVSGQMQNPVGVELEDADLEYYGVEGIVEDETVPANNNGGRPIFAAPDLLSDELLDHLNMNVPRNLFSDNHGIVMYLRVLQEIPDFLA
eukprot:gene12464-13752_t